MSRRRKDVEGQVGLFDRPTITQGGEPTTQDKTPKLEEVVISHRRKFSVQVPFLLDLSRYNNYLKGPRLYTEHDNLFLRTMFGGIKNSGGTPPEIFDGLNALEICLMEAGIYKRKYVDSRDILIRPKDIHQEPIPSRIDPTKYREESRIKKDGYLDGKSLYEVVAYLLTATDVGRIYSRYKREWQRISQTDNPLREERRFKRLNPYDPLTLRQRMDEIERRYPAALERFKEVLAQPFIPPRIVKIDKYGNPKEIINDDGFVTPVKTYRSSVKGRSFYNLREYANQVLAYFQRKERNMKQG